MKADDRLAAAPEIIVVLGGADNTIRRAEAAAALARERSSAIVILSGRIGLHPYEGVAEAETMAEVIRAAGIPDERLRIEDRSRDTIGNALLTADRFLRVLDPRPITVVTSSFHLRRALYVFRMVLGPDWHPTGHRSADGPNDAEKEALEQGYLDETKRMLSGLEPGDLAGIAERMRARWPAYYGDLELGDLHGPA